MGWVGKAVDAFGLVVAVCPALCGLVKIVKGPMTGIKATLQGEADGGLIKGFVHVYRGCC